MSDMHFSLAPTEAVALIRLVNALEDHGLRKNVPVARAVDKLDEQMAQQTAAWERCERCNGSGWVEDGSDD